VIRETGLGILDDDGVPGEHGHDDVTFRSNVVVSLYYENRSIPYMNTVIYRRLRFIDGSQGGF
jgi:hypothetical protein